MGSLKPELSKKSKYWISKHRYYELKHFCLQYPEWKKECQCLSLYPERNLGKIPGWKNLEKQTENLVVKISDYIFFIEIVEKSALEADRELGNYILKAVTEGLSFTTLKTVYDIPCEKDMFYDRYRKFFWILDKKK